MVNETILAVIIAFVVSAVLCPIVIPFLHRLKFGQQVRDDGPQTHLKKQGTPTMGGVMFLAAFTAVSLLFRKEGAEVVPVLFLTLGFGLIGFLDDYLKVVLHRSDGLYPKQKMALQAVITAVFLWYLARFSGISLRMRIPFLPGKELDAGIFTIPFLAFVILGTVNGVNFTDGLDGLAASVTIINAVFFSVASIGLGNGVSPSPLAVIGSLLGFLVFNVFPARVFMGDTGSLALGGFVSGMACFLRLPLFLPLVGFIYMMEILSVILQVSFFKLTKGKRIFKMTPIHHHFEMSGFSEYKIVITFSLFGAIAGLCGLLLVIL